MVRYRRNLIEGGSFFFTVALADRASNHLTTYAADLRAAFRTTRAERPFAVDAIVILPEHLHAILTLPTGDADFPSRWRGIKARFTASLRAKGLTFPARDGRGYRLWQRRFWEHTIRDDADLGRHVDYIHYNPVRHGLVRQPSAWPHSSLHRFIRAGTVPPDWGGSDPGACDVGEPSSSE